MSWRSGGGLRSSHDMLLYRLGLKSQALLASRTLPFEVFLPRLLLATKPKEGRSEDGKIPARPKDGTNGSDGNPLAWLKPAYSIRRESESSKRGRKISSWSSSWSRSNAAKPKGSGALRDVCRTMPNRAQSNDVPNSWPLSRGGSSMMSSTAPCRAIIRGSSSTMTTAPT